MQLHFLALVEITRNVSMSVEPLESEVAVMPGGLDMGNWVPASVESLSVIGSRCILCRV